MSLNRNAKGLKSDRRLEREIYRRDEDQMSLYLDIEDRMLPNRPKRGTLWDVPESLTVDYNDNYTQFWSKIVCMYCWTEIYVNREAYVHIESGSPRCFRKAFVTAVPIPGIHVIEELEIA